MCNRPCCAHLAVCVGVRGVSCARTGTTRAVRIGVRVHLERAISQCRRCASGVICGRAISCARMLRCVSGGTGVCVWWCLEGGLSGGLPALSFPFDVSLASCV